MSEVEFTRDFCLNPSIGVRTMNLFQQLLLAPAALGLLAPIAAQAADVSSLSGASAASAYSAQQDTDAFRAWQSQNQVTSVAQFSDVQPTDWAYQALSNLVERYGCVAGYPDGTFKGKQALSRFEAAALLNACLDRVTEVTDELRRLQKEFSKELAVLKGRVSGLEAKVGKLEATQFSTTTKLQGDTFWTLGGLGFGGNNNGIGGQVGTNSVGGTNANSQTAGGTTFNYDLRLALNTSFTGKDLLFTRLRAGNFTGSGFNGTPYTLSRLDVASPGSSAVNNTVFIDRLFYRFPSGKELTFIVGPIMRNTEALAVEPFYYGDLKLLDAFTVHGAPGTYNKATGGGAGVIWKQNVKKGAPFFGASLSYVAQNAQSADLTASGGIMNNRSQSNVTAQIGYQAQQWKTTFAWRYGTCGTAAREGTQAAVAAVSCPVATTNTTQPNSGWNGSNIDVNNFAYTVAWTPKKNGTIVPSISAGWGYSAYNQSGYLAPSASVFTTPGTSTTAPGNLAGVSSQLAVNNIAATQSWTVALQWKDAFIKGNSAGMAVGQPNFVTALRNGQTAQDGNYVWEWWYKFQVTDKISVSPALFYLSNPSSAGTSSGTSASTGANVFGGLVMAQFKF